MVALILGSSVVAAGADAQQAGNPGTPLAARDLPRGAVLEAADIATDSVSAEASAEIVGWVTRRVVDEGEPLRAPTIAPPELVRSGDAVQLVWRDGSLEILLAGRAMNSAAEGEKVLVRVDLKRRFEGIAESPGVVRLASLETSR